jgi:hypothetical protein
MVVFINGPLERRPSERANDTHRRGGGPAAAGKARFRRGYRGRQLAASWRRSSTASRVATSREARSGVDEGVGRQVKSRRCPEWRLNASRTPRRSFLIIRSNYHPRSGNVIAIESAFAVLLLRGVVETITVQIAKRAAVAAAVAAAGAAAAAAAMGTDAEIATRAAAAATGG